MQNKKPAGWWDHEIDCRQNLPTLLLRLPVILETTEMKALKLNLIDFKRNTFYAVENPIFE